MEGPDERTSLLPSHHSDSNNNDNNTSDNHSDDSDESNSEPEVIVDRTWLRRRSSTHLPPYHEDFPPANESSSALTIWTVVPVSLLGVFVANADGSLVVASSQQIASEFDSLSKAAWLVTSFGLAQCACQPLYGKLSDIFGRKSNLATAYTLFAAGCFLCGIGSTYTHVIAGRAISGAGGAGMTALVSVIIADMVPPREMATWRSYVNIAATTGRAIGGPLGGWLCDTIGWRWCFYGQVPVTVIGLLLILWKLPNKISKSSAVEEQSLLQSFKRVDVVGALLLASTISSFLVALDFSGKSYPWVWTLTPFIISLTTAVSFAYWEKNRAKEPILPIRLIVQRPALTAYLLAGFQLAAQYSTFYATPLYFQVSANVSVANAGLRLVPAVAGNATAGLLSGYLISKTGRYKSLTTVASITGIVGYTLIFIRWRGGTTWWETLYISLGGFGSGAMQSTTFIHLAASIAASDIAIAGTTLYVSQNVFLLIGIQLATTLVQARLRFSLTSALKGNKHQAEIIKSALSSVESIRLLPSTVRDIVVWCYVDSLTYTYLLSIIFAVFGLLLGFTIKEKKL